MSFLSLLRARLGIKDLSDVVAEQHTVRHDPASQCARILRHLQKHGRVTNIELVQHFRILRGSERVRELRQEGHAIRSIHLDGPIWVYVLEREDKS